ncbi:hypothetical protein [Salinimicrobium xinjiangense]|uniref:hypothetical protein n=1 Tax=Salinimicrobium xinjiangense TaxID=438596 RepID=UPI000414EE0B|nr:hypothetical protein [Salinimicrobium xinjiangense]
MKNIYLLLSFLVIGFSAKAVPGTVENFDRPNNGDAFIFVERGVEFAVFPDGQFDFFFNPRGNFNRIPSHINYSFNSGYNYGPFVQYDDYGAVIQIETVPVYYDYYGRIIRAGRVNIGYNAFGMVNRIGNMFLHYNYYNQFTHTSGFINSRNAHYVYRPWHEYYVRPYSYTVVHHQPYRIYYAPNRMKYNHYKRYYNNHYSNGSFQKSYYRPGEKVTTYHRGRRDETRREVRTEVAPSRNNITTTPERKTYRQSNTRTLPPQRAETRTSTTRQVAPAVHRNEVPQVRTSRTENVTVQKNIETRVPAKRAETPAVQRRSPQVNTTPERTASNAREVQAQTRRSHTPARTENTPQVRTQEPVPSRGTRSSRGG